MGVYPQPAIYAWGLEGEGSPIVHTWWGGAFLKKKFSENLVGMVKNIYLWWVGGFFLYF